MTPARLRRIQSIGSERLEQLLLRFESDLTEICLAAIRRTSVTVFDAHTYVAARLIALLDANQVEDSLREILRTHLARQPTVALVLLNESVPEVDLVVMMNNDLDEIVFILQGSVLRERQWISASRLRELVNESKHRGDPHLLSAIDGWGSRDLPLVKNHLSTLVQSLGVRAELAAEGTGSSTPSLEALQLLRGFMSTSDVDLIHGVALSAAEGNYWIVILDHSLTELLTVIPVGPIGPIGPADF